MENTPETQATAIPDDAGRLDHLIEEATVHPQGQALREVLPELGRAVAELRGDVAKLRTLGELAELVGAMDVAGGLHEEFAQAGGELRAMFDRIEGAIAGVTADVAQLKAEASRAPCEGCKGAEGSAAGDTAGEA